MTKKVKKIVFVKNTLETFLARVCFQIRKGNILMKEKILAIFTNKFFIIALLFIAVLFSFNDVAFCSSSSTYTISFSDGFTFYVQVDDDFLNTYNNVFYYNFIHPSNNLHYCFFYYSSSPITIYEDNGTIILSNDDGSAIKKAGIDCSTNNRTFRSSDYGFSTYSGSGIDISNLYFTNETPYNSAGSVVFPQAPVQEQQQGETQGIQTLTLEQAEQIPQAMTQTLQVVIPVGLVVFGIGLVIFLTRYLISRLM